MGVRQRSPSVVLHAHSHQFGDLLALMHLLILVLNRKPESTNFKPAGPELSTLCKESFWFKLRQIDTLKPVYTWSFLAFCIWIITICTFTLPDLLLSRLQCHEMLHRIHYEIQVIYIWPPTLSFLIFNYLMQNISAAFKIIILYPYLNFFNIPTFCRCWPLITMYYIMYCTRGVCLAHNTGAFTVAFNLDVMHLRLGGVFEWTNFNLIQMYLWPH